MAEPSVTELILDLQAGKTGAFDVLLAQVYDELRRLARSQLRRERPGHTLSTVGLVHEAYLKLVDHREQSWKSRAHFFGAAATAMRRILVDHARARSAKKREGLRVGLTDAEGVAGGGGESAASLDHLVAIDAALQRLAAVNERLVRVVECRYFAGLTIEETAEALGVSHATVSDDWRLARAWLRRELDTGPQRG